MIDNASSHNPARNPYSARINSDLSSPRPTPSESELISPNPRESTEVYVICCTIHCHRVVAVRLAREKVASGADFHITTRR